MRQDDWFPDREERVLQHPPLPYGGRATGATGLYLYLAPQDGAYPGGARDLDRPPHLYMLGQASSPNMPLVGVVGTRQPSAEQRVWAARFGGELAHCSFGVCSGFAPGIDRAAHRGCVAAGGATIAVLGEPVTRVLARGEGEGILQLATSVRTGGCFVSEQQARYGRVTKGEAVANLLARNRLIAALARAVVVVAAGEKGGAHETARWAWKLGLPVYVTDFGASTPIGNLRLLLRGATPLPPDPASACGILLGGL